MLNPAQPRKVRTCPKRTRPSEFLSTSSGSEMGTITTQDQFDSKMLLLGVICGGNYWTWRMSASAISPVSSLNSRLCFSRCASHSGLFAKTVAVP